MLSFWRHDTNETKIRVQVGIRVSEGWGIYNVKWENYGIKNELDKLDSIYKPNITELQESDDETNKIEKITSGRV